MQKEARQKKHKSRFRTCSAKRSVRPGIKPKASGKRAFPFPMSKILYNRKKKKYRD